MRSVLLERPSADSLLPSDGLAARRLGIAAAVVAGADFVYIVLYRTLWTGDANPIGLITGLMGGLVSAAVSAYLLSGQRATSRIAMLAVAYEVFLALTLAVAETSAVRYDAVSAQVSWSAVVIVLFPFLIPARPAVVLGASLGAAATVPVAMAAALSVMDRPWPNAAVVLSYVIPPFLCALLAWAPTRVLAQLSKAVQNARRVGSYELVERLGSGGMGEVWLARHRLLARPAAVKLIKPEMLGAKDPRAQELVMRRFEREAQVTASLESPHTVELYDFGVSAEGVLFYVMELLHGVDLETLVERFGPQPSERVVHFLMQACDSLEEAHARGLIHRDIKPANLFVSRKGNTADLVKVLDFGLVKRWTRDEDDELLKSLELTVTGIGRTAAGQVVGTPAFLAPEAALGEHAIDHRVDLYALGCVGYWMLTGTHVFVADSVIAMALAHITKEPEPPSVRAGRSIVPALEALLMSCLQKDPARRPDSAHALRRALSDVPLQEPWTRERALAFWEQHLPKQKLGASSHPRASACLRLRPDSARGQ